MAFRKPDEISPEDTAAIKASRAATTINPVASVQVGAKPVANADEATPEEVKTFLEQPSQTIGDTLSIILSGSKGDNGKKGGIAR